MNTKIEVALWSSYFEGKVRDNVDLEKQKEIFVGQVKKIKSQFDILLSEREAFFFNDSL